MTNLGLYSLIHAFPISYIKFIRCQKNFCIPMYPNAPRGSESDAMSFGQRSGHMSYGPGETKNCRILKNNEHSLATFGVEASFKMKFPLLKNTTCESCESVKFTQSLSMFRQASYWKANGLASANRAPRSPYT